MTIDQFRTAASQATGIPESLLTGSTEAEIASRAKALLAFARENPGPKTTAQQFSEWLQDSGLLDTNDGFISSVPPAVEEHHGYPNIPDGGAVGHPHYAGTPAQQFAQWAVEVGFRSLDFDPMKDRDGFAPLDRLFRE